MPRKPAPKRRLRLRRVEETSAGGLVVDVGRAGGAGGAGGACGATKGATKGHGGTARGALIGRVDRRGNLLWSLPKGHIEPGETAEETAVREVEEETGIAGRVVGPLGTIDFWFVVADRRIHKTVHHYLLLRQGGELSTSDYEVDEVEWVPLEELPDRLAYEDERKLVANVTELLERPA